MKVLYSLFILILSSTISFVFSQSIIDQTNYDVKFYYLDLHLSDTTTYIHGNTRIDVEILENSDSLFLNLGSQLRVTGVQINGESVIYNHLDDSLFISYEFIPKTDLYTIKVFYQGDGNDSTDYGALHLKNSEYGSVVYSLTEPFSTKYWFPCKEVLTDKADSVYIYATVDKKLKVGSVGILKDVIDVDENKHQFRWRSTYPVAFYLISIAVGDYYEYTFDAILDSAGNKTKVMNYIYNSEDYLTANKESIDATKDMLFVFSKMFGLYPFYQEKYGHSIVPLGGGMEHQTMTTLGNFNFDLVSHELAHQWFGDYVTCKYWNDIWINEGFSSYSEYLAREDLKGPQSASDWMLNAHSIILEEERGSVYVPELQVGSSSRIFKYSLSYKKGAAIIHMIRHEIGNDSLFFQTLRTFLVRYGFNTASGEDFKQVLEEVSGKSFDNFFNEWYYGEGYPTIEFSWHQYNDMLYFHTNQSTSAPDITPFFHLKLPFQVVTPTMDTTVFFYMSNKMETFKMKVESPVYDVKLDTENHLLKKVYEYGNNIDSSNVDLQPVLIFPNPTYDEIHVFSRELIQEIDLEVYDMTGRFVKTFPNINPQGASIRLSGLLDGVYIFKIAGIESNQVFKIIKK